MQDSRIMKIEEEISSLKAKAGYLYAGYPKFWGLFGRDSLISSWELLDYDPKIAINTLIALSSLQGNEINLSNGEYPGKIPHEYYDDNTIYNQRKKEIPWLPRGPNYFSVDSTPLFIILVSRVKSKVGDRLMVKFRKATESALIFMFDYAFKGHFLAYEKAMAGSGLQSQSWRDGIGDILDRLKSPVFTVGVQGYAYYALEQAKKIITAGRHNSKFENKDIPRIIDAKMLEIKENLNSYFWLDETSYYALAFDGDGVAERAITSDPAHLLFSGILSRRHERDIIDRIFEDDMITDYGIRTLASSDSNFDAKAYQRGSIWPQDNWIIAEGLRQRGYLNEYSDLRGRLISAYDDMGKLPEYFSVTKNGKLLVDNALRVTPCYPQAWSSGAIIDFLLQGK